VIKTATSWRLIYGRMLRVNTAVKSRESRAEINPRHPRNLRIKNLAFSASSAFIPFRRDEWRLKAVQAAGPYLAMAARRVSASNGLQIKESMPPRGQSEV
jgi:hypothetical protein